MEREEDGWLRMKEVRELFQSGSPLLKRALQKPVSSFPLPSLVAVRIHQSSQLNLTLFPLPQHQPLLCFSSCVS